jgi:hypothetical protein
MISIDEILSRVESVYSSCRSYEDRGCAKLVVENGCIRDYRFHTLAVPPDSFRFECQDALNGDSERAIICIDAGKAKTKGINQQIELSFYRAVGIMHGISMGAATLISTLMFEDLRTYLRTRIVEHNFSEIEEAIVGQQKCYILKVPAEVTVACGVDDYLIRSVARAVPHKPSYIFTEFDFVSINQPLPTDIFRL